MNNNHHHGPNLHSPRPGTHIVSLCCGCGQIRLYTPGSPCMLCQNEACNYFTEYPLQQAWDTCSACGPLWCNLILELSKEQDKLVLIRCCWCKNTKICQDKCNTCGNKGCCRDAIIHSSKVYHQIKAQHVADAINTREDSTDPIIRMVGLSKSISEDVQEKIKTEPGLQENGPIASIKEEPQDEGNVFLRGGDGPDVQQQPATPRRTWMTLSQFLQTITTPSQTRKRDGDKCSVEKVWRKVQETREKMARLAVPSKAEETEERFCRGYGDVSGSICYWYDIDSDKNEEKLQPVQLDWPKRPRPDVWKIGRPGNVVNLPRLLREYLMDISQEGEPTISFQNRLKILEDASILEAADPVVHPDDDLNYRKRKALVGPRPGLLEELSPLSLYGGAEDHAKFHQGDEDKLSFGYAYDYGPDADRTRVVLLNVALNEYTKPKEWLRTLPILLELEEKRRLAIQRMFDLKRENAEDEWLRIFGGFKSRERTSNMDFGSILDQDLTALREFDPTENIKRDFTSLGVEESEPAKRMRTR